MGTKFKTVGIVSEKGGVGKTFNTFNIGSFIATYKNKKVLLIDMDSSGSLTMALKAMARANGLDRERIATTESLFSDDSFPEPNPAMHNLDYYGVDTNNNLINFSDKQVNNFYSAIDEIQADYDLVLFDSAPTFNRLLKLVLKTAEGILIPGTPDSTTFNATKSIIDYVSTSSREQMAVPIGIFIASFDNMRTNLARGFHEVYCLTFGKLMMDNIVGRYTSYATFYNNGSVMVSDSKCKKEFDLYSNFVDEFIERLDPTSLLTEQSESASPSRRKRLAQEEENN